MFMQLVGAGERHYGGKMYCITTVPDLLLSMPAGGGIMGLPPRLDSCHRGGVCPESLIKDVVLSTCGTREADITDECHSEHRLQSHSGGM